jgi:hypothetical protein
MVNGKPGRYFEQKGLRQGDPLSPLLFSLVIDALSAILNKSKEKGILEGLAAHITYKGGAKCALRRGYNTFSQG